MILSLMLQLCISFFNPVSDMTVNSMYNISWNTNYQNETYLYLYHRHIDSVFGDSMSTYENNQPVLKHASTEQHYIWTLPHRLNSYNLTDDMFKFILTNNKNLISQPIDSDDSFFYMASSYFELKVI